MSVELILGGAGTLLGLANFIYWAWWSKRERIKLVNPVCCVWFMHKGKGKVNVRDKYIELKNHALEFLVDCNMVMTRGDKEIEVKGAYFDIGKKPNEILKNYFSIARSLPLESGTWDEPIENVVLYPKKSVTFSKEHLFLGKDSLDEPCKEENYPELPEDDDGKHLYKPPDFLKHVLDDIDDNYTIRFYRYDDKMISWRFPDKWWRNLEKKLLG